MNKEFQVGDLVMSAPVLGTETFIQNGILAMGSGHTHDEVMGTVFNPATGRDELVCGDADIPYFALDSFEDRIRDWREGKRVMTVFRWHEFCDDENDSLYHDFQISVNSTLQSMARMKIPYDKQAIKSHAKNYFRKIVPGMKPLSKHVEYHMFCTEGFFHIYNVAGSVIDHRFNLSDLTGNQPLVAPVHAERLVRDFYLIPVHDYGLMERFNV